MSIKARRFDRFLIDDGRHLPTYVIDEDASRIAGEARWRANCSCDRMPDHPAGSREQTLIAHLAHVSKQLSPAAGPEWLPPGARLVLLLFAMLAIWAACYVAGVLVTQQTDLTDGVIRAGAHLTGIALAFGFMVLTRRFIAPTRA
ncbi:MAG TPA: hypothetical protein VN520_35285 [Streptomyces sp.]|uniref:hypothetical protein n=1 Tax=Streptomyces sp. TaxID=1931 RepID=UPI002BA1D2F6|nr:hypothetical protein [Streptomyces sp.]HWU11560.1 hypothetical protein [Streptomyces sp.]